MQAMQARMKAMMAKMKATMKALGAIRKAERAQMLAALSPAHRAFLASVVGQLAIASNPSPKAAIAQLDAKLTASEKSAILAAAKSARTKADALHKSMMNDMMAQHHPMPAPSGSPGVPPVTRYYVMQQSDMSGHSKHHHHAPTAGALLFAQTGFGGFEHPPMMRMRFETRMHGPMGPGGMMGGDMHGMHGPGPVVPPVATPTP